VTVLNTVLIPTVSAAPVNQSKPWVKLARAMSASAAGAALSGVASIAATKVLALSLGPAAVAALQSLQQARQTAVIAATANGQTALVQGAGSLSGTARSRYVATVACIFLAGITLAELGLVGAPSWMLARMGLASLSTPAFGGLAIAVALTSIYVFLTALLNAAGKVETLAALQVAGPGALALLAYPVVRAGGFPGIAFLVAASAAISTAAALAAVLKHRADFRNWFPRRWCASAPVHEFLRSPECFHAREAAHFFSISSAMLITGFLASAAILLVRGNIILTEGLQRAGLFDAAWSISMNHVTLVLASVQTYYLPALTRARTREEKASQISRVLMAATLVAAPVIAALALFKPLVLQTFYSSAFRGAHLYLRWTLMGDYLKISSWILSVPMLAAADMKLFLVSDLMATCAFVCSALVLSRWREPAESAAMAFLVMYVVHLAISVLYVRFRQGIRLENKTTAIWVAGLGLVIAASCFGWKGSL
jgi:O-antigen/teichoic acid export membrane protein